MTPQQKIKWKALQIDAEWNKTKLPSVNESNIDDYYNALVENDGHWDALSEIREGEHETEIEPHLSYHYETQSVASKMPDGSWVGWTYYYGGGKHGEPEAIDWVSEAYDLRCSEREDVVIIKEFTKV